MTSLTKAAAALMVGAFALAGVAGEEKIALDKVPAKAMKAVKAKFPGAELTGAAKDEEDGKVTYEVMLTYKGAKHDVSVKDDGTITGIEKVIAVDDLPGAVTKAVTKKYPNAKIKTAEEITVDDKTNFEVAVASGGKTFEMVISPKGKIVEDGNDKEKEEKDEKRD